MKSRFTWEIAYFLGVVRVGTVVSNALDAFNELMSDEIQRRAKKWSIGCVSFLLCSARLLLSKAGLLFSPSLYVVAFHCNATNQSKRSFKPFGILHAHTANAQKCIKMLVSESK